MKDGKTVPCSFRVLADDKLIVDLAAELEGKAPSDWLREVVVPAAHRVVARHHAAKSRDRAPIGR